MASHAPQLADRITGSQVQPRPLVRTSPMRSIRRADGRTRAAAILDKAMADRGWSNAMAGRCLAVDPSIIEDMRRGERAFEVGDLAYLGSVGQDVIAALTVAPASTARTVAAARLVASAGRLVADTGEALVDGVIDDAEQARIDRACCAVVDAAKVMGGAK